MGGTWTWRKWNSGIAECFGTFEYRVSKNGFSSWTNSNYYNNAPRQPYPIAFVERPEEVMTLQTVNAWGSASGNTQTESSQMVLYRPTQAGSDIGATINIHTIGRWK